SLKNEYGITLLAILCATLMVISKYYFSTDSEKDPLKPLKRIDTIIPRGFVLNPIEISNKSAAKSLIEDFGIVDLYVSKNGSTQPTSKPVARSVKVIRAPLDPDQFAVLVTPPVADVINNYSGPFHIVIKNPKFNDSEKLIKAKLKRKIYYYDGGPHE
ncbi:MAG: hypothetical protein KDD50_00060, partial [Bdellovibrionales bacterium]|nr:hypothetical protein [Bdellovibrionales bacterium]